MASPTISAQHPAISVVMSVYNSEDFLREAIESILTQDFTDFEFIIINDGSTDSSAEILRNFAANDPRIKILTQDNIGLTKALINGISLARGKYIARQDADDISHPARLKKQFDWLEASEVRVLCGSWADKIDAQGNYLRKLKPAGNNQRLRELLPFRNDFTHTSVMFRKNVYDEAGGYRPWFLYSQDYDLWCRLSDFGELGNLTESLVSFREHSGGVSSAQAYEQKKFAAIASALAYAKRNFSIEIIPGDNLNSLAFSADAAINKKISDHFQTVFDFGLLQVLPNKVKTSRLKLLCKTFKVRDWGERLRLWSLLLLGNSRQRNLATFLRRS